MLEESEEKAIFTAELSELIALETRLNEKFVNAKVKLLEAEGVVTEEAFNEEVAQKLADDLEAKSCAEFGYEGVYHD